MASTDAEPIRRAVPGVYLRPDLPIYAELMLPRPQRPQGSFAAALSARRSAEFFTPISVESLATWLSYLHGVQATNAEDENRQRRRVASFGALHSAHILVRSPDGEWSVYLPKRHALGRLRVDPLRSEALHSKAKLCFETNEASLVALLADRDLADNYYCNPESLLLRDGGVLFGHAALVASALGLAFRILGSTGGEALENLVPNLPFRPAATGLAWIGGGPR